MIYNFKYNYEEMLFENNKTAFQIIKEHINEIGNGKFGWLERDVIPNLTSKIVKILLLCDIPVFNDNIIYKNSFKSNDILRFEVPPNIQIIEYGAFNLSYLKDITFSEGCQLALIKRKAFADTELESIKLPNGLMHLESYVFEDCIKLKNVFLNKDICSIGEYCFYGCDNLEKIYYDGTMRDFEKIDIESSWVYGSNVNSIICRDGVIEL